MTEESGERNAAVKRDAMRAMALRPLSAAEIRRTLERRGHSPALIDGVLFELREAGQIDDLSLAMDYITARAARLRHGRGRLLRDLERRGVALETARAAWDAVVRRGDLDPAGLIRDAVDRGIAGQGGRLDDRTYRRVYNSLLRAGFDDPDVRRELAALRGSRATRGDDAEFNDDFS